MAIPLATRVLHHVAEQRHGRVHHAFALLCDTRSGVECMEELALALGLPKVYHVQSVPIGKVACTQQKRKLPQNSFVAFCANAGFSLASSLNNCRLRAPAVVHSVVAHILSSRSIWFIERFVSLTTHSETVRSSLCENLRP
jgi:hypothetical protein